MTAPASAPANTPSASVRDGAARTQPRRNASASAPASAEKLAALAQLGLGGLRGVGASATPAPAGRGGSANTRSAPSAQTQRPEQRPERGQRSDTPKHRQDDRAARPPKAGRPAVPSEARSRSPLAQQRSPAPGAVADSAAPTSASPSGAVQRSPLRTHPMLEKLAQLYPRHFGAVFLPLKRGIFQDVLAAHPDAFDKAELKVALGIHTRSSRYLQAVASGTPRYDLQGQPVEPVAPEHMHHAVLEIFRRRQMRSEEDLSAQLRQRIGRVFEASGLTAEQYAQRVHSKAEATNALVAQALQEATASLAQAQAVHDAWVASGIPVADFAQAQAQADGSDVRAVNHAVQRIQRHAVARQAAEQAALAQAQAGKEAMPADLAEDGLTDEPDVDDAAATSTPSIHPGAGDSESVPQDAGAQPDTATPENT